MQLKSFGRNIYPIWLFILFDAPSLALASNLDGEWRLKDNVIIYSLWYFLPACTVIAPALAYCIAKVRGMLRENRGLDSQQWNAFVVSLWVLEGIIVFGTAFMFLVAFLVE